MARPKVGYELEGQPVVGTTTVCGILNKPALVGWAGKLCTEVAYRAGREGAACPQWGNILYGTRDDAASAGTLVHEAFEALLRKLPIPTFPDTPIGTAARQGYENAAHWLSTSGLEVYAYERPLISRRYRFGGTPDAIARSGGKWLLLDWKTSSGVYSEMILQMGAYRTLLAECENMTVAGVHLVRFSREHGDFAHHFYGDDLLDQGWACFEHLLAVYPLLKSIEKRVK